jgi:anti-sigma regulatory factor (Ser/Thr protein kinase)
VQGRPDIERLLTPGGGERVERHWRVRLASGSCPSAGAGIRASVSIARPARLHERRPAQPLSIAPLRRAVVAFAADNGASEDRCLDIALAVSEALTAVVDSPDNRADDGIVVVDASVHERSLQVVVCDDGVRTLPREDDSGLGFGLAVIVRLTDGLEIEDAAPGVRLRLDFTLE